MKLPIRIVLLLSVLILTGCQSNEPDGDGSGGGGGNINPGTPLDIDIYISDAKAPSKIVKFDAKSGHAQIFISQNLSWSQDILFLEDKDQVLISNLSSGNISRHNATTGEFIDFFAEGLGGPTRMKVGPNGLLYVLQWAPDGKVLRFNLDGTFVDEFTNKGVTQSIGLDWDSDGNLYVSSYNSGSNGFVRKFDASGNDLGIFIASSLVGPTNIWFDESGNLVVNDWQVGLVKLFDKQGKFVKSVINGLTNPEGVWILDDGKILIGNGGSSAIKMYDKDYKFIQDIVPAKSGGLTTPNAIYVRNKQ